MSASQAHARAVLANDRRCPGRAVLVSFWVRAALRAAPRTRSTYARSICSLTVDPLNQLLKPKGENGSDLGSAIYFSGKAMAQQENDREISRRETGERKS